MYDLLKELFPICRSITGDGNRKTLGIIDKHIPIEISEYYSGTHCYDWRIPEEWNIKEAYIEDSKGNRFADFSINNLHVLNYSEPVDTIITLEELKKHLYSIPEKPELIPYVTSYYKRQWGFCLTHNQLTKLSPGDYRVKIDSTLKKGSLTIGQSFLKGSAKKEILISCYICHPSMANDSLSGVVIAVQLYKYLSKLKYRKYSYRFLFIPETIGSIVYLFHYGEDLKKNLHAGLVLTCLGDSGAFNYKRTRNGNHELDQIVSNVLFHSEKQFSIHDFFPLGSDERQYSSPGFNFPVGSLMRSIYNEFMEYHTSGDNLDLVTEKSLDESLKMYISIIYCLEGNLRYQRNSPFCEPMLGKYNLYSDIGGTNEEKDNKKEEILWILNYSDGEHSLVEISDKMGASLINLIKTAKLLESHKLIYSI